MSLNFLCCCLAENVLPSPRPFRVSTVWISYVIAFLRTYCLLLALLFISNRVFILPSSESIAFMGFAGICVFYRSSTRARSAPKRSAIPKKICIDNSMICSDICINTTSDISKCYRKFHEPLGEWNLRQLLNITSGIYTKFHVQIMLLFVFSLYTLSDLGNSSNLIVSLSRTMTLY